MKDATIADVQSIMNLNLDITENQWLVSGFYYISNSMSVGRVYTKYWTLGT